MEKEYKKMRVLTERLQLENMDLKGAHPSPTTARPFLIPSDQSTILLLLLWFWLQVVVVLLGAGFAAVTIVVLVARA